jgi:hypothetical protein
MPRTQECTGLRAPEDLRHALVVEVEHSGDLDHRHPCLVRAPDRFVALDAELVELAFQLLSLRPIAAGEAL